jgi:hypothetical protein
VSKGLVQRGDDASMTITVEGVEYLEENVETNGHQRLLRAKN